MAFMRLICTANKLTKLKRQLEEEKEDAAKIYQHKAKKPRWRIRHIWIDALVKFKKLFKCSCICPENTLAHRLCYNISHEGSYENYFVKSILGFLGGFFLTYILFMFFVFQLNFKLSTATLMCAFLGCLLTIGLAFSSNVRCVVFLTLPQFFSKKGRQALLAYAFILAITGPAKNTLNNMGILSESLACGQEQLKNAVRQIIDVVKKPFVAIKEAIKKVVKVIKIVIKKIKEILIKIKRVIMTIIKAIKACFEFLWNCINVCNKKLGTPFERCSRIFEDAITDCNAKLGPWFNWLCNVAFLVKSVCYIVKPIDFLCYVVDFISNSIVGVVIRKIKIFIRHIKTMFYVRIKFSHKFEYHSNSSKSLKEISLGIVTEIKERTKGVMFIFNFMSSAATIFFVFIIFKVVKYRYKFLTSERFDNKYITTDFRNIDMQRAKVGRETVLPLNNRERQVYIAIASKRLVKDEKRQLAQAAVILGTATVKLTTHMLADYSLFWIMNLINYYGRFQSKVQAPNVPMVIVAGNGLLADLLSSIVKAFQPIGIEMEIDTLPCLPTPIPPDYDRYVQIATLLLLCWFLTLLEPYGLRFRHWIMCYYHPVRAKQRAIYLYNHIMRSRSSFLKFARRQLRRKVLGDSKITKVTLKEQLRAMIKFKALRICLGNDKELACLLCGEVLREHDNVKIYFCQTPGCPGVYCEPCFKDLKNLCTVCLSPIEYGDLSDIDEEKDSSDDENRPNKKRKKMKCCLRGSKKDKEDEDDDDENQKRLHFSDSISYKKLDVIEEKSESKEDAYETDDTDYSYSYQNENPSEGNHDEKTRFKDLEKQHIPDYASMGTYSEISYPPTETERTATSGTVEDNKLVTIDEIDENISQETSPEAKLHTSDSSIDEDILIYQRERSKTNDILAEEKSKSSSSRDTRALTNITTPSRDNSTRMSTDLLYKRKPKVEEKEPVIECTCGTHESSSTDEYDTSKTSGSAPPYWELYNVNAIKRFKDQDSPESYSSIDSEIRESMRLHPIVPKLDLSFLDEDGSKKRHGYFPHVKYTFETESSRSRSRSSSSRVSVQSESFFNIETPKVRQRKQRNITPREIEPLFQNVDTYEIKKKQEKKVRSYYKASKIPLYINLAERKNKFVSFLNKVFKKRKCDTLPLHETSENIELRSFNYLRSDWEVLASSSTSLEYPLGADFSSDSDYQHSSPSQVISRQRGGYLSPLTSKSSSLTRKGIGGLKINLPENQIPLQVSSNLKTDLWSRYFVPIEDLTPTKELELYPMQSINTRASNHSREPAERDETVISNIPLLVSGNNLVGEEAAEETDSTISDTTCIEILGHPCKYRKKKSKPIKDQLNKISEDTFYSLVPSHKIEDQINPNKKSISGKSGKDNVLDESYLNKDSLLNDNSLNKDNLLNDNSLNKDYLFDATSLTNTAVKSNTSLSISPTPQRNSSLERELMDTKDNDMDGNDARGISQGTNPSYMRIPFCSNKSTVDDNFCTCCQPKSEKGNQKYSQKHETKHLVRKDMYDNTKPLYNSGDYRYRTEHTDQRFGPDNKPKKVQRTKLDRFDILNTKKYEEKNDSNILERGTQTTDINVDYRGDYLCNCPECCCQRQQEEAIEERCNCPTCKKGMSSTSLESEGQESNFFDLPYQNNDDYLELVEELEEKLVSRNRNRVRKNMEEFENSSRNNRPLEKPILNHDEISESDEPILENICQLNQRLHKPVQKYQFYRSTVKSPCRKSNRPGDNQDCYVEADPRSSLVQSMVKRIDPKQHDNLQRYSKSPYSGNQTTRWQMDPRTGEWYKVSDECLSRRRTQCPRVTRYEPPNYDYDSSDPESPRCCYNQRR